MKFVKSVLRLAIGICLAVILSIAVDMLFIEGIWLFGLPELDDVQSIEVAYPSVSETVYTSSDSEDIDLALRVPSFLKYDILKKPEESEQPLITLKYILKDGAAVEILANRQTVWWKGKAYALKKKDLFVNIVKGIFFSNEM